MAAPVGSPVGLLETLPVGARLPAAVRVGRPTVAVADGGAVGLTPPESDATELPETLAEPAVVGLPPTVAESVRLAPIDALLAPERVGAAPDGVAGREAPPDRLGAAEPDAAKAVALTAALPLLKGSVAEGVAEAHSDRVEVGGAVSRGEGEAAPEPESTRLALRSIVGVAPEEALSVWLVDVLPLTLPTPVAVPGAEALGAEGVGARVPAPDGDTGEEAVGCAAVAVRGPLGGADEESEGLTVTLREDSGEGEALGLKGLEAEVEPELAPLADREGDLESRGEADGDSVAPALRDTDGDAAVLREGRGEPLEAPVALGDRLSAALPLTLREATPDSDALLLPLGSAPEAEALKEMRGERDPVALARALVLRDTLPLEVAPPDTDAPRDRVAGTPVALPPRPEKDTVVGTVGEGSPLPDTEVVGE